VPWVSLVIAVVVVAAAWWGAGLMARRVFVATLPPLADLSALPEPARLHVSEADAVARANAGSAEAVGALGRAYQASLMSAPALDTYALAEQLDRAGGTWTYARALVLEERGQQPEASAALARVTEAQPAHGMAWFRIAEMAFKRDALDEAEHAYRRAAEAPEVAPYLIDEVVARQVVPLSAYARLGLARVSAERGRAAEAVAQLDALAAAYPAFGPARTMRMQLQAGAGDVVPVRAYVPPSDPDVDVVVAQSRMRDLLLKHAAMAARGGDPAWREYLVRRALRFNPQDSHVLLETASLLQETGRSAEALDYLRRHQQLMPDDHHALVEEGRALSDLGRYAEAEAVLRRATRVRDAAAEYNLGSVLDRQGKSEEARERYERALAIDPFHARSMNNLGVWLDRRGRSADAIAMLERAVRAAPDNAEAYSNLGSAYIGARRGADALRVLETAIALAPELPDAHNNLGIALAQSGRPREAASRFQSALALDPGHANARRNLDRLAAMAGPGPSPRR
jgi:Flp pilus assembly protein TadD